MKRSITALASIVVLFIMAAGCLDSEEGSDVPISGETEKVLASYPVALDEGQTGSLSVPFVGLNFVDTDVKHHWDMPENITGIMVNVSWQSSGWDVELATGTGECPHSGMSKADESGTTGMISIEYNAPENQTLEIGQWFCHITVNDLTSHRGDSLNYVFEVKLLSYDEVHCEDDVCPV